MVKNKLFVQLWWGCRYSVCFEFWLEFNQMQLLALIQLKEFNKESLQERLNLLLSIFAMPYFYSFSLLAKNIWKVGVDSKLQ